MAKKVGRIYVFLECADCGLRPYTRSVPSKGAREKLEMKKFCPNCRGHKVHKEKKL